MRRYADCDYCGSAGSIEFNMCQVCLKDYGKDGGYRGERVRMSALAAEVDRVIASGIRTRPPAFTREASLP